MLRTALLLAGLAVSGCSDLDYYQHLARGQARILWERRDVDEVLADAATPDSIRQRLRLIDEVRRFARDRIGLDGTSSSYTVYYDTGGEPVAWNVSASPPDRFDAYLWRFPVVGALPYKGYFQRERALAERDRLLAEGFDAVARGVSAYSLLGYLADPILSTMMDDPEDRLVDLVLHELTHATVYVEDHTDYNESLASFVGRAGSLQFLAERYGADSEEVASVRRRRADLAAFNEFLHGVTSRLDSLYTSGAPRDSLLTQREALFAAGQEDYRRRRDELGAGRYDGFLSWKVNNARLLSYRRYNRGLDDFERVLQRHAGDLGAALPTFVRCGDADDPWTCLAAAGSDPHEPDDERTIHR